MKIRTKLLVVCVLLVVPLIASAVVLVVTERSVRSSLELAREVGIEQQAVSLALQVKIDDAETSIYEFQIEGRAERADQYRSALTDVANETTSYRGLARSDQELRWADDLDALRTEAEKAGDELIELRGSQNDELRAFGDGTERMLSQLRTLGLARPAREEVYQEMIVVMLRDVGEMQRSVGAFLLERNPVDEVRFTTAEFELNATLLRFSKLEFAASEVTLLDDLVEDFEQIQLSGRTALSNRHQEHELITQVSTDVFPAAQQVIVEQIQPFASANLADSQEELSEELATLTSLTLLMGAFVLTAALAVVWWLVRGMDHNIAALEAGAIRVSEGKLAEPIDIHSRDELAYVGQTFNTMMADLAKREGGMQRRIAQLEALRTVGLQIARLLEPEQLVQSVVLSSRELIGAHEVKLSMLEHENGEQLVVQAAARKEDGTASIGEVGTASVLAKVVLQSRQTEVDGSTVTNDGSVTQAAFPLALGDRLLGVFEVSAEALREDDLRFLELVSDQIAVAWENARLYRSLADSEQRTGELAVKVAHVQEEERRLVGLDLHDGLAQIVLGARMHLSAGRILLDGQVDPQALDELQSAEAQLGEAIAEVSWMITELRPSELEDYGLRDGLETYVSKVADDAGWALNFRSPGFDDSDVPDSTQTAVFRIVQEALSNARKHAKTAAIDVSLGRSNGYLVASVTDFGQGFDADRVLTTEQLSLGLIGMRERTELLGGVFDLQTSIGAGTTVRSSVPIPESSRPSDDGGVRHAVS